MAFVLAVLVTEGCFVQDRKANVDHVEISMGNQYESQLNMDFGTTYKSITFDV